MQNRNWSPIALSEWRSVPCVSGRLATAADCKAGRAAIGTHERDAARYAPTAITFPACAIIRQCSGDPPTPVLLINGFQPVPAPAHPMYDHERPLFGFRRFNGGHGICGSASIELILREPDEAFVKMVEALPPPHDALILDPSPQKKPLQEVLWCSRDGKLIEIIPDGRLRELLTQYDALGGPVRFLPMNLEGTMPAMMPLHTAAAKFAMRIMARLVDVEMHEIAVKEWMPRDHLGRLSIDETKFAGTQISANDFVGRSYQRATRQLTSATGSDGPYITNGYASAFVLPPCRSEILGPEADKLFAELNLLLFGGLEHPALEIVSWSPDCSNYFDAGKEWWGAHFWTVFNRETRQLVAILGSATD